MFNRILRLQQKEYGPHDRRCFVTVDKINMVQGKGVQYENAIEKLRKTFSMPEASTSIISSSHQKAKLKHPQNQKSAKNKNRANKVLKVFSSIRKKNP